jgi:hypothetical protein
MVFDMNDSAMVVSGQNAIAKAVAPTAGGLVINTMADLKELCSMLCKSGYFQDAKDLSQAVVKVMYGAELGFPPIMSMKGIHIIKGNPSVGAGLIAAKIKSCRPRYDYRVIRLNPEICELQAFEDGLKSGIVTFTAEEARIAGTQNMGKFPKNMLFARCISNLHRFYLPDLFNGAQVYTPEEFGAEIDDQGRLVDIEQEPDPGYDNRSSYTPPVTKPVVPKSAAIREGFITEAQGNELWSLAKAHNLDITTFKEIVAQVQGIDTSEVKSANIKATEFKQILSEIVDVGQAALENEAIAKAEIGNELDLIKADNEAIAKAQFEGAAIHNAESTIPGLPKPMIKVSQLSDEELEALDLDSEPEDNNPEEIEF